MNVAQKQFTEKIITEKTLSLSLELFANSIQYIQIYLGH